MRHLFYEPSGRLREAEDAAAACLAVCVSPTAANTPIPIPVEEWVETRLGYDFEIGPIDSVDGYGIDGLADLTNRRMLVNQRIADNDQRFRFVVAHELGHLTMHRHVAHLLGRRHHDWFERSNPYERQADRFAAAFLMPPDAIARELVAICSGLSRPATKTLVGMMTGSSGSLALWRSVVLPSLAAKFAVSQAAVVFRLLGLRGPNGQSLLPTLAAAELLRPA